MRQSNLQTDREMPLNPPCQTVNRRSTTITKNNYPGFKARGRDGRDDGLESEAAKEMKRKLIEERGRVSFKVQIYTKR